MQDGYAGIYAFHHRPSEYISSFQSLILSWIFKALTLNTGHIKYISLAEGGLEIARLRHFDTLVAKLRGDLMRHLEKIGGDEDEAAVEMFVQFDTRMDGPTVLQVTT